MNWIEYLRSLASARMLAAVVVGVLVFVIYQLVIRAAWALTESGKLDNSYAVIRRLCRWFCVIVGGMLVLQTVGWLHDAWTTITAVFTLIAVGFVAVWSVLSHTLSSLILMMAGPFSVGDTIEFADDPDLCGEVVDFSLFFTVMQAPNGDLVQVPNNIFFQKAIRRRPADDGRSLDAQLEQTADFDTESSDDAVAEHQEPED